MGQPRFVFSQVDCIRISDTYPRYENEKPKKKKICLTPCTDDLKVLKFLQVSEIFCMAQKNYLKYPETNSVQNLKKK